MENEKCNVRDALKYLKAGYHLYSVKGKKKEDYVYLNGKIFLSDENKSVQLGEYDFLSLYEDTSFFLSEDENEEVVDIKKDEEYYSWRQ
mgnify:CR=1 FL=1